MTTASGAARRFWGAQLSFLGALESFLPTAGPFRIGGTGSIGEDVFVVRHQNENKVPDHQWRKLAMAGRWIGVVK